MSTRYVYVDESKRTGYVLAATTVPDFEAARRVIRGLILPGQRRLHMKHEQPRRRRAIVSALVATTVETTIYDGWTRASDRLGSPGSESPSADRGPSQGG